MRGPPKHKDPRGSGREGMWIDDDHSLRDRANQHNRCAHGTVPTGRGTGSGAGEPPVNAELRRRPGGGPVALAGGPHDGWQCWLPDGTDRLPLAPGPEVVERWPSRRSLYIRTAPGRLEYAGTIAWRERRPAAGGSG